MTRRRALLLSILACAAAAAVSALAAGSTAGPTAAALAASPQGSPAAVAPSSTAFTAEELVARNLEARGGAARLAAIRTMHAVGKVRMGAGRESKTEAWAVARSGYRTDLILQGMTAITAWDGQEAWAVRPFGGRREPQKLAPEEARGLIEAADIAGPLVDHEAKGNAIAYLGTEDVDGTEAHELRVTLPNGDLQYVYLDPDHFLEIRVVRHRMVRGQPEITTVDLGEYAQVDGLYFPFEIGRTQLESMELDVPVDRKMFAFPGSAR